MIEKITYIAFDGEEFEEKEDCVAHEKSLSDMSEHVRLFDADFSPIEWNPEDYDGMWDNLTYIVIEPHYEEEVEEWWNDTFYEMLSVSPFYELDRDWKYWLMSNHSNEPTILVLGFNGNEYWEIFNKIYAETNKIAKGLNALF